MKRATLFLLAGVVLSAALSIGYTANQAKDNRADVALQAAIKKETIDGDLKGAIEQYKKIAAQPGAGRAAVATALLRMGQCYEKLGDAEARTAYQRLVRDYTDQSEIVAQARVRLAALGTGTAAKSTEMTIRWVWAGSGYAVSPDGRYVSYTDWETGDLAVHDLVTGENRRVTKNKPGDPYDYSDGSIFSRDGKQIAHNWQGKSGNELRTTGLDGSETRVVYGGKERQDDPYPVDWSSDGKYILTKLWGKDRIWRLAIISIADGSVQGLAVENPGTMCFSPDGSYIAYDAPQAKDARQSDVYAYDRTTQRSSPLVRHPAHDRLLGWAPDGRSILFASDRQGTNDAWLTAVSNGQPRGEPTLVRKGIGNISGRGFSRAGAYYFAVDVPGRDIYTARLDLETGKLLSPPAEAAGSYLGSNWGPDFSRDGKFLAYVSERGSGAQRETVIVIRSLETEKERLVTPALEIDFGLRWAPDGKSVFINGADENKREGIFRVDSQTGEASFVLEHHFADVPRLEVSPDGRTLFYTARTEPGRSGRRLIAHDLQSGQARLLARPSGLALALSPDGEQLAFSGDSEKADSAGLFVMPSAGGPARLVAQGLGGPVMTWSPDGRYLICSKFVGRAGPDLGVARQELWRVPVQGGEPQRLDLTVTGVMWYLRMHPDGQRILYGSWHSRSELWVLENFLPAAKGAPVAK